MQVQESGMRTDLRAVQWLKAQSPMRVQESGIRTDSSWVQS